MDLNRDNIKKLLLFIVFAIAVFTAFQRIDKIFYYIGLTLSISLPFIIGGAIAFILNVPMNAIEKYIFNNKKPTRILQKSLPIIFGGLVGARTQDLMHVKHAL